MTTAGGEDLEFHFWSIGDFYKAILNGFESLHEKIGKKKLFCGEASRQVGPEYYHSAGGEIVKVSRLPFGQGSDRPHFRPRRGLLGENLRSGRRTFPLLPVSSNPQAALLPRDARQARNASRKKFAVYLEQVYPILTNAKVAEYPAKSELREQALHFNWHYQQLLGKLEIALNGKPRLLMAAFADMFKIKEGAMRLIHNPIRCGRVNAAPTFEMNQASPPPVALDSTP